MVGGPRRGRFPPPLARPLATIQTLAKWPKTRGLELAQNRPFLAILFFIIMCGLFLRHWLNGLQTNLPACSLKNDDSIVAVGIRGGRACRGDGTRKKTSALVRLPTRLFRRLLTRLILVRRRLLILVQLRWLGLAQEEVAGRVAAIRLPRRRRRVEVERRAHVPSCGQGTRAGGHSNEGTGASNCTAAPRGMAPFSRQGSTGG